MLKIRNKVTLCSLEIVTVEGEEKILKLNDDGKSYIDGEALDIPKFKQIEELINHLKENKMIDS